MNQQHDPPLQALEELGLRLLLERIHRGTASASEFGRVALIHPEFVQGGAVGLREAGKHKLQVLRAKYAASNDALVFDATASDALHPPRHFARPAAPGSGRRPEH